MASDLSSSSSVFIRVHLWLDVVAVLTDSANPSGYLMVEWAACVITGSRLPRFLPDRENSAHQQIILFISPPVWQFADTHAPVFWRNHPDSPPVCNQKSDSIWPMKN